VKGLANVPVTKHPNSINASSPAAIRRTNKSISRKRENHYRLAEIHFTGFIAEIVTNLRNDGLADLTPADLLSELLHYSKKGGKRLLVRMPNGRLQVHRAFDWNNPGTSYPVIETEQPDDITLPIYSSSDFSYLDGLARDLREQSDDLGLPWDITVSICESLKAGQNVSISAAVKQSMGDTARWRNKAVVTVNETATILRVSRSTIYRWLDDGKLTSTSTQRESSYCFSEPIRKLFWFTSQQRRAIPSTRKSVTRSRGPFFQCY